MQLAVDSGMATAIYEIGPQEDMSLSAIYDEQAACHKDDFIPIHTVARFEESAIYQELMQVLSDFSQLSSAASPSMPAMIHSISTIHDTAKENGSQSLQYQVSLVSWGGEPIQTIPTMYSVYLTIDSDINESFFIQTSQTNLETGTVITKNYTLTSGQAKPVSYYTYNNALHPETWVPVVHAYSSMTITITPSGNNRIPDGDRTVEVKVHNHRNWYGQEVASETYVTASGTIKDDDNWVINSRVMDEESLEPCIWLSVEDRIASYYVYKTPGDANCTDNSYPITVEFELGGTAEASSWSNTDKKDYQLFVGDISNWNNSSSYIALTTVNGKTTGKVTIPAGQAGVTVNLIAMTDSIFENPETASLTVIKAYAVSNPRPQDCFTIGLTGGSAMIFQAPEFISDIDKNVNTNSIPFPINADNYKSYISINAQVGDEINTLTPITAEANRGVRYMIVQGNIALFEINATTGVITVKQTLKNVDNLQSVYHLRIRAYDPNTGNGKLYDEADVTISISQWTVSRDNAGTAPAIPTDGCTIAELADEIGLNANEFKQWLTTTHQSVRLFDGSVIDASALTENSILAGNQIFENGSQNLAVPNTIYMAWFGEAWGAGKEYMHFNRSMMTLPQLGFNVIAFDNDTYLTTPGSPTAAKWVLFVESNSWQMQNQFMVFI